MKTKRKKYLSIILLCLAVVLVPANSYAQDDDSPRLIEYVVTATNANLRAGPGTSHAIAGTVTNGDTLLIYDEEPEESGWLRIYREGEEDAYIADFLVERAPTRFYLVTQQPIFTAQGTGKDITDVFDIPAGAYRIDVVVQDNSFILESIAVEGDCRDRVIFNELNFDISKLTMSALFISQGCSILFETDNVSGAWEFQVRDILDVDVMLETLLEIETGTSITGFSRTLTMPTRLPPGIWTISAQVKGTAFILAAQVLSGDCDDGTVFNELDFDADLLEASTVYRSPDDGCLIFWETDNVDGEWELVFEKLQ